MENNYSKKFCKMLRETPMTESFAGVFLENLRYNSEQLFHRTPLGNCFYMLFTACLDDLVLFSGK